MASFLHQDVVQRTLQGNLAMYLISDLFVPRCAPGLLKMWVPLIFLSLHFACRGTALAGAASGGSGTGDFFLILLLYPTS